MGWHNCMWVWTSYIPVSILYKSIAGRYRPVRVADWPITARYRFIKNASWISCQSVYVQLWFTHPLMNNKKMKIQWKSWNIFKVKVRSMQHWVHELTYWHVVVDRPYHLPSHCEIPAYNKNKQTNKQTKLNVIVIIIFVYRYEMRYMHLLLMC